MSSANETSSDVSSSAAGRELRIVLRVDRERMRTVREVREDRRDELTCRTRALHDHDDSVGEHRGARHGASVDGRITVVTSGQPIGSADVIVHRGGETVVEARGEAPCTELCHFESVERPYGVRLAGEIDASNVGRLDDVLAALSPGVDVHVDMTRLQFIDLCGLRVGAGRGQRIPPPAWC